MESLLSTSFVSLSIQKLSRVSSRAQILQSLLEEVNEKMNRESDICREVEHARERILITESLNELQLSQQESSSAYHSGKSSPLLEDQISSTPESISEPVLHSSSSLAPLCEDVNEKSHRTQRDFSDPSTGEGSGTHLVTTTTDSSLSTSQEPMFINLRNSTHSSRFQQSHFVMPVHSSHKERPLPPMRTCSYMSAITPPVQTAVTVDSQEANLRSSEPAPLATVHFPSNSLPDSVAIDKANPIVVPRKKNEVFRGGSRPQSAPSSRHYQANVGSSPVNSSFEHYSSHVDPLALTPPKPTPSGPPASVAVLRSSSVPYYTATSRSVSSYGTPPATTEHCLPVQCWHIKQKKGVSYNIAGMRWERHRRQGSSHSTDGDDRKFKCLSQNSYELTGNTKHRPHRVNLSVPRSRVTSYPSAASTGYCSSSMSSTNSVSSGHTTPVVIPSTPIMSATEGGPTLAFDFSSPLVSQEDPQSR